ncbi:MAG: CapA family protein [Alistipes sp.]
MRTFCALLLLALVGCRCTNRIEPVAAQPDSVQCRHAKVVFIGDVMAHLPQVARAHTGSGYDFAPTFRYVAQMLGDADLAVANLETTLSDTPPYTGYPQFRAPAEIADALKGAGIDVAVLANNHVLDYGAEGVRRTIGILDRQGIAHTGTFADSTDYAAHNPLHLERNGIRIALLNYTYGTNGIPARGGVVVNRIDTTAIKRDIAHASESDCIIAYMHWGDEYMRQATKEQRGLAEFLHSNGVDVVIGSHPHVVQPYERNARGGTLYSLGNFVSNQRRRYCDGGVIATLDVVCRGDSTAYTLAVTPAWVRQSDYAVIPQHVGDTLAMSASDRTTYGVCMADAAAIIGQ